MHRGYIRCFSRLLYHINADCIEISLYPSCVIGEATNAGDLAKNHGVFCWRHLEAVIACGCEVHKLREWPLACLVLLGMPAGWLSSLSRGEHFGC